MLIFWEQRLVFLATPKAGSSAIEVALESLASLAVLTPPEMKHVNTTGFHRHIHPWLKEMTKDEFTTVALMREPLEWLRSWYRFHLRDTDTVSQGSFEDFALRYLDAPASVTEGIPTQSSFLISTEGQIDRIFRYEEIDTFTHFLDERLNCVINLPRINVPPKADVTISAQTEMLLKKTLEADFKLYNNLPNLS